MRDAGLTTLTTEFQEGVAHAGMYGTDLFEELESSQGEVATMIRFQRHYELAARDASLGVGHIWTTVSCPAYRSLDPSECTCRRGEA